MTQNPDLLELLIDAFMCLPGVGKKTAQRFAYYLLERDREGGTLLGQTIERAMTEIKQCEHCRMLSESTLCTICSQSQKRDGGALCIVETPSDLLSIEKNTDFRGTYFVLHGKLSPMDNIGPEELGLPLLEERFAKKQVKELILATSSTIEGDVTSHVIRETATRYGIDNISRLACGVPVGGELEFVDATTLAQAFSARNVY